MFIATLFTIAKLWKQPRCPTINEWIKKSLLTVMQEHRQTYPMPELLMTKDWFLNLDS
jgi:hypothetical protein